MQLVRFRIDFGAHCSLGPGKIALLEAIAGKGSLTRAAARRARGAQEKVPRPRALDQVLELTTTGAETPR